MRQWGACLPHVAGICGQSDYGAQSVALSGGYEDDEDHGEWFLYTGRLQNTPTVSYTEVVLSKKGKDDNDLLMTENSRPEVYTKEHEKLLGDAIMEWTLFVDGYGKDGKKIYDQVRGKTCHQCRQKTLGGHRTHCIKCNLILISNEIEGVGSCEVYNIMCKS